MKNFINLYKPNINSDDIKSVNRTLNNSYLSGATKIVNEFENRRNFIFKKLNELENISCFRPGGAFYAFPNVSKSKLSGEKFAEIALNQYGVALVPGTSFGDSAKKFVRISYANSLKNIEEAIKRISEI